MHYLIEHSPPVGTSLTPGRNDGVPEFIALATPAEAEQIIGERVGDAVSLGAGMEGELRGEFGRVAFAPVA